LAKIRAAVVNTRVLAEIAGELGLGDAFLLGRGEEASGGRAKASILADALEAVIGAYYLDAGWQPVQRLVLGLLRQRIERAAEEPDDFDHKSRLQELSVRSGEGAPRYVVEGSGPDHDRQYAAEVFVGRERWGAGRGSSKKDAEQDAARRAWQERHGA
jgi:ribonuclease III